MPRRRPADQPPPLESELEHRMLPVGSSVDELTGRMHQFLNRWVFGFQREQARIDLLALIEWVRTPEGDRQEGLVDLAVVVDHPGPPVVPGLDPLPGGSVVSTLPDSPAGEPAGPSDGHSHPVPSRIGTRPPQYPPEFPPAPHASGPGTRTAAESPAAAPVFQAAGTPEIVRSPGGSPAGSASSSPPPSGRAQRLPFPE